MRHSGKRWTRTELQQLIDEGDHGLERYELFDGDLIDRTGKSRPHVVVLHRIAAAVRRGFGEDHVAQRAPISLRPEDREFYRPEPDVIVLRRKMDSFLMDDPGPEDIFVAIEVADSSLRFDLAAKSEAYARAGIPEYWVIDATGRRIVVHRMPLNSGYGSIASYSSEEQLSPEAQTGWSFLVACIFEGY